jgi:tRNA pseudouridine55 synthase
MALMDGAVVLDKPEGITSHDAVRNIRRIFETKRVGHLGTLDPIGTGVLPHVIGRATRLSKFFLRHDRAYETLIRFGFSTTTYDREGEPVGEQVSPNLAEAEIVGALDGFRGRFDQTPPPVSAKKIQGVRAYRLVRQSRFVELKTSPVEVYELDLLDAGKDYASIRLRCSAGTYVRSIAHELGQKLGCGAHVERLRRVLMGEFSIGMARSLDELERMRREDRLVESLIPLTELLPEIPAQFVDEESARRISHGQDFHTTAFVVQPIPKRIKAIGPGGKLLAIGELRLPGLYHPSLVL